MQYQERIVAMTENAAQSILASARAMPADKLVWQVDGAGRSALDQVQEVAQSMLYSIPMLLERKAGDWDMDKFAAMQAERRTWETLDVCEEQLWANFEKYKAVALAFPDSDLDQKIWLPFGKGFETNMAEILAYPYWNATYHLGVINFIQTLYGDWEMHHA